MNISNTDYAVSLRQAFYISLAVMFAIISLIPVFGADKASAAQLTNRSVTISTSNASATSVTYTYGFTTPATTNIGAIVFEACTTPLGTCTAPTGAVMNAGSAEASRSGWTSANAFTRTTSTTGNCTVANNVLCLTRTAASETAGARTLGWDSQTNPSSAGGYYIRITTYSDDAYATAVDNGTVAYAIVNQLTVNGRVQERLEFCISSIDDAAALPADVTACAAIGTTVIDIGSVDNSTIARSPVDNAPPSSTGNDAYGIAMINTNGSNGTSLTFFANQAASGAQELRAFRVTGATCNVSQPNSQDQCFISASTSGESFVAGTERFGTYIPCIDTTQGTTSNLGSVPAAYSGTDADTASGADCENEAGVKFAWNDTSTAATLASASTVIDDEIVKIRFGATASATTPTGAYTVQSTYIATPTF